MEVKMENVQVPSLGPAALLQNKLDRSDATCSCQICFGCYLSPSPLSVPFLLEIAVTLMDM